MESLDKIGWQYLILFAFLCSWSEEHPPGPQYSLPCELSGVSEGASSPALAWNSYSPFWLVSVPVLSVSCNGGLLHTAGPTSSVSGWFPCWMMEPLAGTPHALPV